MDIKKTVLPLINIRVNRRTEKMINLRFIEVLRFCGLSAVGASFFTKYSFL